MTHEGFFPTWDTQWTGVLETPWRERLRLGEGLQGSPEEGLGEQGVGEHPSGEVVRRHHAFVNCLTLEYL